jgi:hypothetical protein
MNSLPAPEADAAFTVITLQPGRWFHIYCTESYPARADSYNEGWGDTRFAPIRQADGSPAHTYYAASTVRCAMLESVLHDVPLQPPGVFDIARLKHFHLATIDIAEPIQAVSFHSLYLPKLHLSRTLLIDSPAACYRDTRPWAEAAFLAAPQACALAYGSRRDDGGHCIMLHGQRFARPLRVAETQALARPDLRDSFHGLIRSLGIAEI